MVRKLNF